MKFVTLSFRVLHRKIFSPCSSYFTQGLPKEASIRPHGSLRFFSKIKGPVYPVFLRADKYQDRTALIDCHGNHLYKDILGRAVQLAQKILDIVGEKDLDEKRISFLCPNNVSYVICQWATWMAGGVAVPLYKNHPSSEIQYFIENSESSVVITTECLKEKLDPITSNLNVKKLILNESDYLSEKETENGLKVYRDLRNKFHVIAEHTPGGYRNRHAMIIYTSGTTGRPKGVVLSYGNLNTNIEGMIEAWGWTSADTILHVLPLHHIHGIVNALMTPLSCGATCVMLPNFNPKLVWETLVNPITAENQVRINLFMAVPTIYKLLIDEYEKMTNSSNMNKEYVKSACCNRIRLMVSGSAALPQPIMERWCDITGHMLLERYGMTEIGMALTNPLNGKRVPGSVGKPFPGVEVCIAKDNVYNPNGYDVIAQGNHISTNFKPDMENESGELYVKGPNVFMEYFKNPGATKSTFSKDGWFKTGDTAVFKNGAYSILGRTSVDIIKSGGYKISALDIERHLLTHPDIKDCVVVGLPDLTWGQRVAAVIIQTDGSTLLNHQSLKNWAKHILPSYQIPSIVKVMDDIPKNAMGKVNKKLIVKNVFPEYLKSI